MRVDARRALGVSGELTAERALARAGIRTIARNARTRFGEIDLICRDARGYVFVEVKTRHERSFVTAVEAATGAKVRRLTRLAWAWLAHAGEREAEWRMLIAAVTLREDGPSVEIIPVDRC